MIDIWYLPFLSPEQKAWLFDVTYQLWRLGFPPGYPPGG